MARGGGQIHLGGTTSSHPTVVAPDVDEVVEAYSMARTQRCHVLEASGVGDDDEPEAHEALQVGGDAGDRRLLQNPGRESGHAAADGGGGQHVGGPGEREALRCPRVNGWG